MRAQISSEFFIVYAILLTIFIIVFTIYLGGNYNLAQIQDSSSALRNSHSVAATINYVYLAGEGASYNLSLNSVANSENITISNYSVTSNRQFGSASSGILISNINSTSIYRGNNIISNNEGEIHISR